MQCIQAWRLRLTHVLCKCRMDVVCCRKTSEALTVCIVFRQVLCRACAALSRVLQPFVAANLQREPGKSLAEGQSVLPLLWAVIQWQPGTLLLAHLLSVVALPCLQVAE